jgi:hypothetical protein
MPRNSIAMSPASDAEGPLALSEPAALSLSVMSRGSTTCGLPPRSGVFEYYGFVGTVTLPEMMSACAASSLSLMSSTKPPDVA